MAEVKFVNAMAASGFLNGVVNVAFAVYQFLPETDTLSGEVKVMISPEVVANLRFDLHLAIELRDRLDAIIEENTKPKVSN
jgi:hypothetical protein